MFSVGTRLSYEINERFYCGVHFVWCSMYYDNLEKQAATSNPLDIALNFVKKSYTHDRHNVDIDNNKAGILRGAKAHLDRGDISKNKFRKISQRVASSSMKDFLPVLYIIDKGKIDKNRIILVPQEESASDFSIEYRIEDLSSDEFQVIDMCDVLPKSFVERKKVII